MQDPNQAIPPDYAAQEFEEDREPFLNAGLTDCQVADILAHQWALRNNRDKEAWNRRQWEAAIAAAEEEEHQEVDCREQEDEEAQILKDKHKKNKAKYAPIPNVPVPSEPIILLSQVTVRKIQQHKFCKLWYFTNDGLNNANATLSYTFNDNTLLFIPSTDGVPTLVPVSATRDKSNIIQDENLSLEQFRQSGTPHDSIHVRPWLGPAPCSNACCLLGCH